jgi:hypothetical protein
VQGEQVSMVSAALVAGETGKVTAFSTVPGSRMR